MFARQIAGKVTGGELSILITTSNHDLLEFTNGKLVRSLRKTRSAVYSQSGQEIVALTIESDHHIDIFKSGSELKNPLNSIKLTFSNELQKGRDHFRTYYITESDQNTFFLYSAFYPSEGDFD